ncbi:MAG: hypothetical protein RLZZ155_1371 [Bacteroidota bacterium]|jgi:hypothetical protein
MKNIILALICSVVFFSCKEESSNFKIAGRTKDASSNVSLPYVSVSIEQKALVNGILTNYFQEADATQSDINGSYALEWKKENIVEARLMVSREFYYSKEIALSPDQLRNETSLEKDIALWPESSVNVTLANLSGSNVIQFNWINANFECTCCSNEVKTFTNLSDTTFQCSVYGGKWIKYNCVTVGSSGSTFLLDSLYCLPFQTNNLSINL